MYVCSSYTEAGCRNWGSSYKALILLGYMDKKVLQRSFKMMNMSSDTWEVSNILMKKGWSFYFHLFVYHAYTELETRVQKGQIFDDSVIYD